VCLCHSSFLGKLVYRTGVAGDESTEQGICVDAFGAVIYSAKDGV